MLKATAGESFERTLPDAGMMRARCVVVLDLGTHRDAKFLDKKGQPVKRHLVQIQFELDQMMEINGEQKPMMATMRQTLSLGEKANLRKHLETWRGKKFSEADIKEGFDLSKILGKPALLNIQHSDDGKYANVMSINPPMKPPAGSDGAAPQFYPSRFFDLSDPSADVWATLSQKTRDFIAESEEVRSGQVTLPKMPTATDKAEPTSEGSPF